MSSASLARLSALVCVLALSARGASSPNGRTSFEFKIVDGAPVFAVAYDGKFAASVAPMLELDDAFAGGFELAEETPASYDGKWTPVWGDRAEYDESWRGTKCKLRERGPRGRTLVLEARAYAEGFAVRMSVPCAKWKLKRETTRVSYPDGAAAWPIHSGEATYPERAIAVKDVPKRAMLPFVAELADGRCVALLEANARRYPRATVEPDGKGGMSVALLGKSPIVGEGDFVTPWRALQFGRDAAELVDHSSLVLNLNPPCAIADASWIRPGLCVSKIGNCSNVESELEAVAERAASANFKYLQIDACWYGTEWTWTDAERETFRKTRPDLASQSEWVTNTFANPYRAAKGIVPYRPTWKGCLNVDLDPERLAAFCRARGMGLCLYLHGKVLEENDLDRLFAAYAKWGVVGLKPGFVRYGDAYATEWNWRLAETAARHKLWLDVHDAFVPDGSQRTWPNLMIAEGGGGEEGRHPVRQDVTHPFSRCLAGPFDFTPMAFRKGVSHAHVAAFFTVYPGPTAVMRGGMRKLAPGSPDAWGAELEMVSALPMNYDDSKTLDAKIGAWIVTARRKGATWHLAGMAGAAAHETELRFDFLDDGVSYELVLARDAAADVAANPASVRETRKVRRGDAVRVAMSASGGFVAVVRKAEN